MAKVLDVTSPDHFGSLIRSSSIVVTDFYADWCGPCKVISPIYDQLASQLSRPNKITFTRVNTDNQKQIAQSYNISALPTFIIFKNGRETQRVKGANPQQLSDALKKLAAEAESASTGSEAGPSSSSSSGSHWLGADIPRGYSDITDQVDTKDLDLMNADSDYGNARTLFEPSKPSSLTEQGAKGKEKASESAKKDWVESDTDEQLMLYIPFMSTLKVHSLLLTCLPPSSDTDDDDEIPMRPKTLHLYTNRISNLGFEEAEDTQPTQIINLEPKHWNEKTGTAKVELRYVKFQNVTSLVMFVKEGDGEGERCRIDRVRVLGEAGEKRSMGKLEKVGDEQGE